MGNEPFSPLYYFPMEKILVISIANCKNTLHVCMAFFSGEERMRHRDTVGQGHRLCLEGDNGEKEERLREKRHKNEGWQKSSRRSNRDTLRHLKKQIDLSCNYFSSMCSTAAAGVGGMMVRTGKVRTDTIAKRPRKMGRTKRQASSSPLTMRKIKTDWLLVS